jgi:phosphohistidine phosphatase SixA
MNHLFLARHGRANGDSLTLTGREDALAIARQMQDLDGESGLTIITSTAGRALETTRIIKTYIGETVVRSVFMELAGLRPSVVDSLHDYTHEIIEATLRSPNDADNVLIVAHNPLVRAVTGADAKYGTVYQVAEQWQNLDHDPQIAAMLLSLPPDEVRSCIY